MVKRSILVALLALLGCGLMAAPASADTREICTPNIPTFGVLCVNV